MARLWADFPEGLAAAADLAAACTFRLEEIRGEHPLPPVLAEAAAAAGEGDRAGGRDGPAPAAGARRGALALRRRAARRRGAAARPGARARRAARLRELLPHRLGRGPLRPRARHPLPGAGQRGQLGRLLRARHHLHRPGAHGAALRALPLGGAGRAARHRRRLRARAARGGASSTSTERYGRDRAGMVCEVISYRGPLGHPRRGQGARARPRPGGPAGQAGGQPRRGRRDPGGGARAGRARPGGLAGGAPRAARSPRRSPASRATSPSTWAASSSRGGRSSRPCRSQPAAMAGRTVVQWDKDDLAELGLLKVDLLALGMLTALSRSLALLARHRPAPAGATADPWPASLAAIPAEEPAVYEMISPGRHHRRLPDRVAGADVAAAAAAARAASTTSSSRWPSSAPGPSRAAWSTPSCAAATGWRRSATPTSRCGRCWSARCGIPLFQEQAMRLAVVAAGFTPGEADELRRAMTHKRSHERIEEMRGRLMAGMAGAGIPRSGRRRHPPAAPRLRRLRLPRVARRLLRAAGLRLGLAEAAPPGRLRRGAARQPAHGLLRAPHAGGGRQAARGGGARASTPSTATGSARWRGRRRGSPAAPGERPALRLGLSRIRGLPRAVGEAVLAARREAPFASVEDLARRARLSRAWLARLAEAGALRSLAPGRRAALWTALGAAAPGDEGDLFAGRLPPEPPARARAEPARPRRWRGTTPPPASPSGPTRSPSSARRSRPAGPAPPGSSPGCADRAPVEVGGHRHRPAAAGDGARDHLRLAGGRDRHRQPGGHARRLRALPAAGARRALPHRPGAGRAHRQGGEPSSAGSSCRSRRSRRCGRRRGTSTDEVAGIPGSRL